MRQNAERMVEFLDMRRSNASEYFLPHTHDYYELSYLTNGHTKIKLNGLLLTYEAYDFVLVPAGVRHNLYYAQNEKYDNCTIWFRGDSEFLNSLCRETQAIKLHDYDGALHFLGSEIFRLHQNYGSGNAELFDAYLYAALLHMRRGDVMDTLAPAGQDEDPVERAVRFINDNILLRPVTVSAIAEELGLSPAYFTRLFQRRIGMTPVKYIIEVRVAQAKRMLTEENYSIKEIAAALHYEDQLYFSRQFTKATGLPPRKYREQTRR